MCMNGNEVETCCECSCSDFDEFMVHRGEFWFCKECDPGEESEPDKVDFMDSQRNGGWR